ncbi:MAG: YraN family protein [Candidatus Glassbacteria bacterium]
MSYRQQKGLSGEMAASRYLQSRGYRIIEHRYRHGRKEIDLVAGKDELIVFVEVKTRTSERYGPIRTSVTGRKKRNLVDAAAGWLAERETDSPDHSYRFDVILISRTPDGKVELEHIEDAFRA